MKVIADVMLTDVGRWLRIIGVETYIASKDMSDEEILYEAKKGNFTILTEDEELSKRAKRIGLEVIFVYPRISNLKEKLLFVLKRLKISKNKIKNFEKYTLCTKCGGDLKRVNVNKAKKTKLAEIKQKVPAYILKKHEKIWICKKCNQIYWEGSHWKNIQSFLNELIKEIENSDVHES